MRVSQMNHLKFLAKIAVLIILAMPLAAPGWAVPHKLVKGEWKLPDHYPDGFHGYGCLQELDETRAVINDSVLQVSPNVEFYLPDSKYLARRESIPMGALVGYMFDENDRIISFWLINKRCDSKNPTADF